MAALETIFKNKLLLLRFALFFTLFTLAKPAGIAFAQPRRVLIVEHVNKEKKPKLHTTNDYVILKLTNSNEEKQGRISALTDSSLILGSDEYVIREISYFRSRSDGKLLLKGLGWSFVPIGLLGMADAISAEPWLHPHIHAISFGGLALSIFLVTRKTDTKHRGPETGWRFRMKTIE